ncbi:helix-turn-helix domain-containing protein [Vibrio astriarenae]|uniref:Helix-turn-helix domain-containing protein n=1 Tax=Vibrio astriarenae TaxID=1481923 RepID=A0A7Z2YDV2_9VIBR|nr:helix-turn-helix domain-containing protein [Vibrio astriarenae]QIA63559.1 helix-turn-helix domain-containing protein [Vibrio astriarenae]
MNNVENSKFGSKLNRKLAAEYLGVTEGTLAVWASTGRYSLPFVKVGRKVFYTLADLDAFLESRVQTQTA